MIVRLVVYSVFAVSASLCTRWSVFWFSGIIKVGSLRCLV